MVRAALSVLFALSVWPAPDGATALFLRGQQLETAGNVEEACAAYLAVADQHSDSPSAPSALHQCALLRDEQQHDVTAALALYRRLLRTYPASRASARAEKRMPALTPFEGAWAVPYRDFQGLLVSRTRLGDEPWERAMRALVDRHPHYPVAADYLIAVARSAFKRGDKASAGRNFAAVLTRHPGTVSAAFAAKGLADLELQAKNYGAAVGYYDAATVLAARLGVPPPAPQQRIKAHLYAGRYRVLLGAILLLIVATASLLLAVPPKSARRAPSGSPLRLAQWRAQLQPTLGLAIGLLPLFGVIGALTVYLAFHHDEEKPLNITGREPAFIAACYALTVVATLLSSAIFPLFVSDRRRRLVFWGAVGASLLAASYCLFYVFDLVYYLESLIYQIDPQTGLPRLPGL